MNGLRRIQFEILLAVVSITGGGFIFSGIVKKWTPLFIAIASIVFIAIIVLLILQKVRFDSEREKISEEKKSLEKELGEEKLNIEKERMKIEREREKKSLIEKEESTNLLSKSVEFSTYLLRTLSEKLREFMNYSKTTEFKKDPQNLSAFFENLTGTTITQVLKCLRIMFEGDTRSIDRTTYPHNFFKAAFFKKNEERGKIFLKRIYFDYPEGIEPNKETGLIDVEKKKQACHVLACQNDVIEIIQDIPSEVKKPESKRRWMNIVDNQHEKYKSMFCASIVKGKKGTPARKVLGVIVVDTNRDEYFLENEQYKAFLARLISPFRTLLSIAISLEELRESFLSVEE